MGEALFDRVARLYDYEQRQFTRDIPFYLEYAKACGGEVLEVACGTGRILVPIARQGVKITGLDVSRGMLDVCQKKVDADDILKKNVALVHADMTRFDLGKRFTLIYIAFRSFQCLLTRDEQVSCLRHVHDHLADDGTFILDLFAPRHDYLAEQKRKLDLGTFHDDDYDVEINVRTEDVYDLGRQTLHEDRFYEWMDKDGKPHQLVWSFDLAYLFRYEAELLLEKCGFSTEEVYADFDKQPYDYYSGEQIFVARKAAAR